MEEKKKVRRSVWERDTRLNEEKEIKKRAEKEARVKYFYSHQDEVIKKR